MGFFKNIIPPAKIKQQTHTQFNDVFLRSIRNLVGLPQVEDKAQLVEEGYQKNATVYSIVNYINSAGSNVPIKVYEVVDRSAFKDYKSLTGGDMNDAAYIKAMNARTKGMKPAPDSDLQKLLDKPNPDMGYTQFFQELNGFFQITGDSYLQGIKRSNDGKIIALYPLPAQYMEIVLQDSRTQPIAGYKFNLYDRNNLLSYEDVAHVKTFNPDWSLDGSHLYGQSPLTAASRNLTINNDSIDTGRSFLKNQGVAGILASDDMGMLTEEQASALKDKFRAKYQGTANANDIMITNHMFKWIQMGLPAADLALIEQYNLSKKDIAAAYNFPSLLLNDTDEFSVSTYREAKKQLYLQKVIPDLRLIRDELNRWLTPTHSEVDNKEYYIDFDYMAIPELQEDMEKVTKQLNVSWWLTPNQKLLAQGYDESDKEGMDDIYVPANLINLSSDGLQGELEGGDPIQRLSMDIYKNEK